MNVTFKENSQLAEDIIILEAKEKTDLIEDLIAHLEQTKIVLKCKSSLNQKEVLCPIVDFFTFFSANKKVYGKTKNSEYIMPYRLYELEHLLQKRFIRISNTEIINLDYVQKLEVTNSGIILILFKNGEQTSSSRRYLKEIKERLL